MANNNKNPKTPAKPAPAPVSRIQRALTFMAASILGLGVIAIVVLLIGEATLKQSTFEGSQFWTTVALLPAIAIPLGFVLFIALIIVTVVQRSRAAKVAG